MKEKDLNKLLKMDSLYEAEKLTGKSYKEDEFTGWMGILLQMENSKQKNEILQSMDDTFFSNKVDDYLRKVKEYENL